MTSNWSKSWNFGRKKVLIYQAECMWTMRLGQYPVCFCKCRKCWPMSKLNDRWNKDFSPLRVIQCQKWATFICQKVVYWIMNRTLHKVEILSWTGPTDPSDCRRRTFFVLEPFGIPNGWTWTSETLLDQRWESCLSDSSGCMMIRRVCFYLGQKPAWSCCPYASHNPCWRFSSQHRDCKSSSAGEAPFPFNF